jgi:hypothetical protein
MTGDRGNSPEKKAVIPDGAFPISISGQKNSY